MGDPRQSASAASAGRFACDQVVAFGLRIGLDCGQVSASCRHLPRLHFDFGERETCIEFDGKLDLAVSIANAGSIFGFVTILPGNGDGTFGSGVTLASGALPSGIVAADFNGDGGLDLATANGTTGGDSGSVTVLLNEPVIGLTPSSLTFAAQKVGTSSAAQVVTLDNPGATPLKVTSITISGDYSETNDCPAKLTAGKSCTINVTFSPTQTGARAGSLSIKDAALTSVQKITLTGSGT